MNKYLTLVVLILITSCSNKPKPTVGSILASLPKNDSHYSDIIYRSNLEGLRLEQPKKDVITILKNSNHNFTDTGDWIRLKPRSASGIILAQNLTLKFDSDSKVEFMILDVGGGLRFVVNH